MDGDQQAIFHTYLTSRCALSWSHKCHKLHIKKLEFVTILTSLGTLHSSCNELGVKAAQPVEHLR